MKIKKFRIKPRLPTVGRILKGIMGTRQLPPELEASIPTEAEKFLDSVQPAAFYSTWSRDQVPPTLHDITSRPEFSRAVAITITPATIGSKVEENLAQLLLNGETQKAQLMTALCEESAEMSFQFMERLLKDNADDDDCETALPVFIQDGPLLGEALRLLEIEGNAIQLDAAGHLSPRFTRLAVIGWFPLNKRKKSLALSKKAAS